MTCDMQTCTCTPLASDEIRLLPLHPAVEDSWIRVSLHRTKLRPYEQPNPIVPNVAERAAEDATLRRRFGSYVTSIDLERSGWIL